MKKVYHSLRIDTVTRVEVIENGKRMFVKWDCHPAFLLQDGGRTLKIFIDGEKLKELLENHSEQG